MKIFKAVLLVAVLVIIIVTLLFRMPNRVAEGRSPSHRELFTALDCQSMFNFSRKRKKTTVHVVTASAEKTGEANDTTETRREVFVPVELPPEIISGIKKLVLFVGYGRSGHSIIGSLMDTHPHVVVSHEFHLLENLPNASDTHWKSHLFNSIYQKSARDVTRGRAYAKKGYTLGVKGLWQGRFDGYIEVIGDKGAGRITTDYLEDKKQVRRHYSELKKRVEIPIRVIHVLRNPFDMISTATVILNTDPSNLRHLKRAYSSLREHEPAIQKYNRTDILDLWIDDMFVRFDAVLEMIDTIFGKENVLEVHNCDLVADPRHALSRIFEFLDVDATEHYLSVCSEKVFKSVSRSRNTVVWSSGQIERAERRMKKYAMLNRYNFTSD